MLPRLLSPIHPSFFGLGSQRLFGVYYAPTASPRCEPAVLVCPPVGHEHVRSQNALRKLCERLAGEGVSALRFDYRGLGDSSGDASDCDVSTWREDVTVAAAELCRRSGQSRITLVGLRLGAALAAGVKLPGITVENLLLWDPVVSGERYLAELERMQRRCLADTRRFREPRSGEFDPHELLGFPYPQRMRKSIAALSLLNRLYPYDNCCLVTSHDDPAHDALSECLSKNTRGRPMTEHLPEKTEWGDHRRVESALVAPRSITAIVQRICNGFT